MGARRSASDSLSRVVDDRGAKEIGPWESLDAIDRWRGLDGWKSRIARVRELLEGFEASTLDVAVEVE